MKKKSFVSRLRRGHIALYVINSLLSILYISPLLWMISSSFKPENRIFSDMTAGLTAFLPFGFTLNNYYEVFLRSNLPHYIFNSLIYVSILVSCSLFVNSMCGYALAKFEFRGKSILFASVMALLVLPLESIILSLFWLITKLSWNNSYTALIVPFIAKCFNIYLFRQFFLDIPDELIEASAIDGATPVQTFFSLVVPISGPVFATVLILDCVAYWSDFMWPLLVINSAKMRTVQLGLQVFFTEPPIYYGPVMAALSISAVPITMLFCFFQKYYVQGISATGIKG